GPDRRAAPPRPGAARAAAHDRARLAPRLRHPARQEGLPAHERELRPLPAARARAAGPRQEARHGRAGARRAHALAGERAPGRGAGGLPVGGVIPVAAVAAADPGAALDQLARLRPAAEAPPAPGRVAPLLRLLGGSPALAGALVAEGAAWPALVAAVHEVPARGPDAQRAALAAAGAAGP